MNHVKSTGGGLALFALLITLAGLPAAAQAGADTAPAEAEADAEGATIETGLPHRVTLYAGQSQVLESPWPVRRISVTDPNVADVQVLAPERVQLQGKALGSTDVMMWGENDEVWRADVVVQPDLTDIESELAELFPRSSLKVSQMRGVVVVRGVLNRVEHVDQLRRIFEASELPYIDLTSVGGVQQVQLQVRVAEVSRGALRTLGVNTLYSGDDFFGGIPIGSSAGPLVPMNAGVPAGTPVGDLGFEFLNNVNVPSAVTLFGGVPRADLQVFIQALAENQYLQVLAEPTLVALSGEEATFLAGGEFPVPVAQVGGGGTTEIAIEYREFGVLLRFRPLVLGDGTIRLHVFPEVSELSDVGAVEVLGTRVPSLLKRRVETTLELKSGQSFGVAGLIDRNTNARLSEVPGLGRLPVLGPLFRSVRYAEDETELLILVTASLVEPLSTTDPLPMPGALHSRPSDWELFAGGRLEGSQPAQAGPAQAERLQRTGLDQLKGPGAWMEYDASLASPEPTRERATR
ncbi:MAG: pilus assembly protein N-terminal domain-containing protein [Phycisphaeraceae bacterium]